MFVYEQSGCRFESCCSHLIFSYRVCSEQGVPWHSGNCKCRFTLKRVCDMIKAHSQKWKPVITSYNKFQCIVKLQKQCNLVISSKLAQKVFFLQEDDKLLQSVNKLDWVISNYKNWACGLHWMFLKYLSSSLENFVKIQLPSTFANMIYVLAAWATIETFKTVIY